jgi:hypothetical protein
MQAACHGTRMEAASIGAHAGCLDRRACMHAGYLAPRMQAVSASIASARMQAASIGARACMHAGYLAAHAGCLGF